MPPKVSLVAGDSRKGNVSHALELIKDEFMKERVLSQVL